VRWLAPELVYPEEFGLHVYVRSRESDVYALAMVMFEVRVNHYMFVLTAFSCVTHFRLGVFWVTPV
jgi:hypothetical protein